MTSPLLIEPVYFSSSVWSIWLAFVTALDWALEFVAIRINEAERNWLPTELVVCVEVSVEALVAFDESVTVAANEELAVLELCVSLAEDEESFSILPTTVPDETGFDASVALVFSIKSLSSLVFSATLTQLNE